MYHISTQKCRAHGHPELILSYDPAQVLENDVRWFALTLEKMVESGSRFSAGESLQLGWSTVWFSEESGALGFEEPDMRSIPVVRRPGLTQTLRHLRLHKDVVDSVLPIDALSIPSFRQSCLVCSRLGTSSNFIMDRQNPSSERDSGWFIGCGDRGHEHNQAENLIPVSLYEATIIRCPAALPFLALPAGTLIAFDRTPKIFKDRQALAIRKGSFLDQLPAIT